MFHSWLFFLLEERDGEVGLVMGRVRRASEELGWRETLDRLGIEVESRYDSTAATTVPSPPASIDTHTHEAKDHTEIIDLYEQIFGSFYSNPLRIPPGTINTTLLFSEFITQIALDLGCIHLISAQLGTALQAHRQALFVAIKNDPARWLKLALHLENEPIYTEALVHIIGAHPCWPCFTKRTVLPEEITKLVASKAGKLEQAVTEAERELLLLTIQVHNGSVQPQESSEFDTWFIVQTFRDQLARDFHALDTSKTRTLKRGLMIRQIKAGGSTYMPYEEMRRLMGMIMPSAVANLEEDLGLLKKYASEIVGDLARNGLCLDVERNGVGYLTCVEVGRGDVP